MVMKLETSSVLHFLWVHISRCTCKRSAEASMDFVYQLPWLHGTIITSTSNAKSQSTKNYHCKSTWLIFRIRLRSEHNDQIIYSLVPRILHPSLVINNLDRKEGSFWEGGWLPFFKYVQTKEVTSWSNLFWLTDARQRKFNCSSNNMYISVPMTSIELLSF